MPPTPWLPEARFADDAGAVRPEFIWSALDCPGGFVINDEPAVMILLGRMSALQSAPESGLERWNTLEMLRWLCDNQTFLHGPALHECNAEVENACLRLLSDNDQQNRKLSLEILASGYATAKSSMRLRQALPLAQRRYIRELIIKALRHAETDSPDRANQQ